MSAKADVVLTEAGQTLSQVESDRAALEPAVEPRSGSDEPSDEDQADAEQEVGEG